MDKVKITDQQRAAATAAATRHKALVLDSGPGPWKAPDKPTPAEIEAGKEYQRAHDEWHAKNKEPVVVEMTPIDAAHAVGADPERFTIIPPGPRAPVTLEERVTALERRLGPETAEETDKIAKRDAAHGKATK